MEVPQVPLVSSTHGPGGGQQPASGRQRGRAPSRGLSDRLALQIAEDVLTVADSILAPERSLEEAAPSWVAGRGEAVEDLVEREIVERIRRSPDNIAGRATHIHQARERSALRESTSRRRPLVC